MKNPTRLFAFSTLAIFSFGSCVKQVDQIPTTPGINAEKFSEIKAADNFNWSTTNKINFSLTGSASDQYELVLKVMDPDGNILIRKLQKSNENLKATIELPSRFESITVVYGSKSEQLDCTKGSASITIDQ